MEYHFKSEKTYRYFTLGDPQSAKKLLLVMHGYGQLAEFFIRKFTNLGGDYFIVAPEGMHRFYLNGVSGRVGASWMTKEAREIDISDNLNWLSQLLQQFDSFHFEERILLGFSQGGATAARFYYSDSSKFSRMILWASVFPPDLDIRSEINSISTAKNHFVIGKQDQYFDAAQQKEIKDFYRNLNFEINAYEGGHDIDKDRLLEILK